jgi:hypothetical protein
MQNNGSRIGNILTKDITWIKSSDRQRLARSSGSDYDGSVAQ